MIKKKYFYALVTIFIFYSEFVKSGSYESAIDAQSEVMRQTLQDAGELEGINRERWNRLTDRERLLISNSGKIFDDYYTKYKHYPLKENVGFMRWLYKFLSIRNQAEEQIVLNVLDGRVESKKTRNDICRGLQGHNFGTRLMDNFCKK